jgi:hypothetical protein
VRRFGKYGKKDKLNSGMMEERQVEMWKDMKYMEEK